MPEPIEDVRLYRVGDLTDFRDTDPFVVSWDDATKEAQRQYEGQGITNDSPIGIWRCDSGGGDVSLDGIYFAGWVFTP